MKRQRSHALVDFWQFSHWHIYMWNTKHNTDKNTSTALSAYTRTHTHTYKSAHGTRSRICSLRRTMWLRVCVCVCVLSTRRTSVCLSICVYIVPYCVQTLLQCVIQIIFFSSSKKYDFVSDHWCATVFYLTIPLENHLCAPQILDTNKKVTVRRRTER